MGNFSTTDIGDNTFTVARAFFYPVARCQQIPP